MKVLIKIRLILLYIALAIVPSAHAVTTTATFQVLITILKACTVTAGSASNINLGSVNAGTTNVSGSSTNAISVNCSKSTPYFIGLAPSAANGGNTTGAGAMSSVANSATNTDKVPYQLNQTSATGPVWGNTATSTVVGNGVAGTGTGAADNYTVYATAPGTNYTPDSYADTVTVNVNY